MARRPHGRRNIMRAQQQAAAAEVVEVEKPVVKAEPKKKAKTKKKAS